MLPLLSILRAAAETTRLRIFALLINSELTVSELVEILKQSQPRVSRHLKLLCESGLLTRYQEGSWVFHRLSDKSKMASVIDGLTQMIDLEEAIFAEDQSRLQLVKDRNARQAAEYFSNNAIEWDDIRKMAVPDRDIEASILELLGHSSPDLLIDLGTGTGRMLQIFSPYINRGIGIDINREMLQLARSNLDCAGVTNCTVRLHDFNQTPFDDETVDAIVIHQVLHYIERPEKILLEATRILKVEGQLIVVDFLPHELEFLRQNHAHRRLGFADKTLTDWGKVCGLKASSVHHLHPEENKENRLSVGLWNFKKA